MTDSSTLRKMRNDGLDGTKKRGGKEELLARHSSDYGGEDRDEYFSPYGGEIKNDCNNSLSTGTYSSGSSRNAGPREPSSNSLAVNSTASSEGDRDAQANNARPVTSDDEESESDTFSYDKTMTPTPRPTPIKEDEDLEERRRQCAEFPINEERKKQFQTRRNTLQMRRRMSMELQQRGQAVIANHNTANWEQKFYDLEVEYSALTLHSDALCAEIQQLNDKWHEDEEYIVELEREKLNMELDIEELQRVKERVDMENTRLRRKLKIEKKETLRLRKELERAQKKRARDRSGSELVELNNEKSATSLSSTIMSLNEEHSFEKQEYHEKQDKRERQRSFLISSSLEDELGVNKSRGHLEPPEIQSQDPPDEALTASKTPPNCSDSFDRKPGISRASSHVSPHVIPSADSRARSTRTPPPRRPGSLEKKGYSASSSSVEPEPKRRQSRMSSKNFMSLLAQETSESLAVTIASKPKNNGRRDSGDSDKNKNKNKNKTDDKSGDSNSSGRKLFKGFFGSNSDSPSSRGLDAEVKVT